MNKHIRRSLKGFGWLILAAVILLTAVVTVLARPARWFDNSAQKGSLTLYSDRISAAKLEDMAANLHYRLEETELFVPEVKHRVFICVDEKLYGRFTGLARVPSFVPGFNLSVFNNSFVSVAGLERRALTNRAGVEHSTLAGGLEQGIAHELIHDYVQEHVGFFAARRLPWWNMEGYAEYASNQAVIAADTDAALQDRIRMMQTAFTNERARDYYEWNLVVEYLAIEREYSFTEIMADSVTLESARAQMMAWSAGE